MRALVIGGTGPTGHFVVKYCPADVKYVDDIIVGTDLNGLPPPPPNQNNSK